MDKKADTANIFFAALESVPGVRILTFDSDEKLNDEQQKGNIAGIVNITKNIGAVRPYTIGLKSTNASGDKWPGLKSLMQTVINNVSDSVYKNNRPKFADFNFDEKTDITQIREYKRIDFILPGQLGFSLLSAGVFGVAFMFYNLRSLMVLKRFFATPISRTYIILGEGLSRVIFQMLTAVVIILVGYFLLGFTLVHGAETLFEMLILSFIGLLIFMGFGFIVSGLAKNDSTIPAFANIITLPQFLLGGTFFPPDAFPAWLQPISKALPLTHLNTLMRSVAFEGEHFWNVNFMMKIGSLNLSIPEILVLFLWAIIVYFVAIKVFKWE